MPPSLYMYITLKKRRMRQAIANNVPTSRYLTCHEQRDERFSTISRYRVCCGGPYLKLQRIEYIYIRLSDLKRIKKVMKRVKGTQDIAQP